MLDLEVLIFKVVSVDALTPLKMRYKKPKQRSEPVASSLKYTQVTQQIIEAKEITYSAITIGEVTTLYNEARDDAATV